MDALQNAIQGEGATVGSESAISDTFDTKKAPSSSVDVKDEGQMKKEPQQEEAGVREDAQTQISKSESGAQAENVQASLTSNARAIVFNGKLENLSVKGVLRALAEQFGQVSVDAHKVYLKQEIKRLAQERVDQESAAAAAAASKRKVEEKAPASTPPKKKAKKDQKEEKEEDNDDDNDDDDEDGGANEEEVDTGSGGGVDDLPTNIEMEVDLSDFLRRNPSRRGRARTKPPPQKKARKKKAANSSSKRKSGFTKPMMLSDALAEFLGTGDELMARTEVVKRITAYVKEHNLQNPKDRRKIMFDEALQNVFKRKTSTFFQLQKHLTKHIFNPNDVC